MSACSGRRLLEDDVNTLTCEWREIPKRNDNVTFKLSKKYPNKNRYADVLACDKTLVKLTPSTDNPDGYINANYISLPSSKVIGTQAPLPSSFNDFWQMIWEKKIRIIVMLTRLEERRAIKSHLYWPEDGSKTYGNYTITLNRYRPRKDYDIRSLSISNGIKERKIYHLQFTGWPDFGVPTNASSIIQFLGEIEKHEEKLHVKKSIKRPSVVYHCSAGIGRIGTFLTFQYIIEQLQNDVDISDINIPHIIKELRKERAGLVQTLDQYLFIYQAVNEYLIKQNASKARNRRGGNLGRLRRPVSAKSESVLKRNANRVILSASGGPEKRLSRTLNEPCIQSAV